MPKLTLRDRDKDDRVRRWQVSLRAMIFAVLVIGAGAGLFARWWFAPMVVSDYHKNGVLRGELWRQRNWRGEFRTLKTVDYYSNGQKMAVSDEREDRFWAPNGEPTTLTSALRYMRADNGDGTFCTP